MLFEEVYVLFIDHNLLQQAVDKSAKPTPVMHDVAAETESCRTVACARVHFLTSPQLMPRASIYVHI